MFIEVDGVVYLVFIPIDCPEPEAVPEPHYWECEGCGYGERLHWWLDTVYQCWFATFT